MAIVKLAKIATVITKGTTPTSIGFDFVADGINFVKIENITEDGCFIPEKFAHITEECHQKLSRSILQKNDVLFSIAGAIGRTAIVNENILPANTNQALAIIRIPDGVVNYSYLKYVLESPIITQQFEKKKQGVAQLNISLKDIGDFTIPLPSLVVQQKIVATLTHTDTLISLRKQQIAKLDELVKARFVEMFGDPKANNKVWKMNTFADICSVRQGLQIPISKRLSQYEEGCYEYITVAYLHGSKEREYIRNPKNSVICSKEDILMTRTGNTGMVITDVAGVFHNNFFLIDFDRSRYNKFFLVEYLNLDLIQAEIKRRAGTSTIPDLNHGEFYAISIYEPPIDLQRQFAAFVAQTDQQKLTIQHSLAQLELLKKALMQKYFG